MLNGKSAMQVVNKLVITTRAHLQIEWSDLIWCKIHSYSIIGKFVHIIQVYSLFVLAINLLSLVKYREPQVYVSKNTMYQVILMWSTSHVCPKTQATIVVGLVHGHFVNLISKLLWSIFNVSCCVVELIFNCEKWVLKATPRLKTRNTCRWQDIGAKVPYAYNKSLTLM